MSNRKNQATIDAGSFLLGAKLDSDLEMGCARSEVKALKLGNNPADWMAIRMVLNLIFVKAAPLFPHGVLFNETIGGLPVPGKAALTNLTNVIKDVTDKAAKMKIQLCDEGDRAKLGDIFVDATKADDPPPHPYFEKNCQALQTFIDPKTEHCRLALETTRVMLVNAPAILKLVVTVPRLLAVISVLSGIAGFGSTD